MATVNAIATSTATSTFKPGDVIDLTPKAKTKLKQPTKRQLGFKILGDRKMKPAAKLIALKQLFGDFTEGLNRLLFTAGTAMPHAPEVKDRLMNPEYWAIVDILNGGATLLEKEKALFKIVYDPMSGDVAGIDQLQKDLEDGKFKNFTGAKAIARSIMERKGPWANA